MKIFRSLLGGFLGASVLTAMHQLLKNNYSNAPRMDLLAEEALEKGLDKVGVAAPPPEKMYKITMAGDLIMNTLFFSAASGVLKASTKGTMLGLAAGFGGLYLPEKMGLNPERTNKSLPTKILTVAIYTIGGYVAGRVTDRLTPKEKQWASL